MTILFSISFFLTDMNCVFVASVEALLFTPKHSLTGPVGQPFASRLGGAAVHVHGDAPTLTMEPGSPVSDV